MTAFLFIALLLMSVLGCVHSWSLIVTTDTDDHHSVTVLTTVLLWLCSHALLVIGIIAGLAKIFSQIV